jgi:hypothetical protein
MIDPKTPTPSKEWAHFGVEDDTPYDKKVNPNDFEPDVEPDRKFQVIIHQSFVYVVEAKDADEAKERAFNLSYADAVDGQVENVDVFDDETWIREEIE